ncbi:MAG: leucyl/phenylalanyl-tRNA--protein transferase, partial [Enterobacterales bacterium]|nr:leucyl/phenylalanyl-tRNA--protein transferase [Enterobacterales bacterium]
VGGLYGVLQGSLFCGESMFSRATNASKTALIAFCEHFVSFGGTLIDCQVLNAHTESLGARNIPRSDYLHHLRIDQNKVINPACWKPQTIISREFAIKPHQNCP